MSQQHHNSPDVAVVGGGVIGLAVAWRAAARGLSVVVLDRDAPGAGASRVAAGMLAPISEAEFGDRAPLDLGLAGAARWPAFAEELAAGGADIGFRRCGTLFVARDADDAEALERELAHRDALGLPVERLLPSRARRLEPALAPTVRLAIHVPDDHAVDPRALTAALSVAAERAGARLEHRADVAELTRSGRAVTGVRLADGRDIAAGAVVVAAGAWSGALEGLTEDERPPVRPVKGQLLNLRDPAGPGLVDRVLRLPGAYLVPRGDGRYVLGASVEERGFDTAVTAGAVYELLRDAGEVLPGIWELEIEEALAGLRPGTPDNAPLLGPAGIDNLVWATGHFRNGILLAPITGEAVAAWLTGDDPPREVLPFGAERFVHEGAPA